MHGKRRSSQWNRKNYPVFPFTHEKYWKSTNPHLKSLKQDGYRFLRRLGMEGMEIF